MNAGLRAPFPDTRHSMVRSLGSESAEERGRALHALVSAYWRPVYAHAHGVVHRDLKPENVMVGSFGEVLVMDWGAAKVMTHGVEAPVDTAPDVPRDGGRHHTAGGTVMGTAGYMAPEQARGDAVLVDQRADVYALGGLLHFLLTGHSPVDMEQRAMPDAAVPGVPRALSAICRRALAASPAERYPDVPMLAADVAAFVDGAAVSAYRERALDRVARVVTRYRTPILLVLAYVIVRAILIFATTD